MPDYKTATPVDLRNLFLLSESQSFHSLSFTVMFGDCMKPLLRSFVQPSRKIKKADKRHKKQAIWALFCCGFIIT